MRTAPGFPTNGHCTAFDATGGFDERCFAAEDEALNRTLARQGRTVILREPAWTSDRKLCAFDKRRHGPD